MTITTSELRTHFVGLTATVPVIGGHKRYINFDNAASTPPFKEVMETLHDYMPWYSSVHRGTGFKSRLSTATYESARHIIGQFVGADMSEHTIIFGKNTTEALNKAAYRIPLRKQDVVLISPMEHHSNDLPWRAQATVVRIAMTPEGGIDKDHFEQLLREYGKRVKLVAISGASNVTGYLPDIHWFARKAHAAGAHILVDAAQLAAHRPIHMGRLSDDGHIDYLAFTAHKMYAPFGMGALVGRRDTFETGAPEYSGGGTVNLVTATRVDWADTPDRDEAGSPNVPGAVAFARSIQVLKRLGVDKLAKHEADLTAYALRRLQEIPDIHLYGITDPARAGERSGVIPFNIGNMPHALVAAILGYEWGIGVRSGCFCAHPYVTQLLKLDPTLRKVRRDIANGRRDRLPGMVRVSFGAYNTKEEIDVLITALTAIAAGKHARYRQNVRTGEYIPVGERFDFGPYFSL